jgi:hypothetical protein
MADDLPDGVAYCSSSTCWACGRVVKHKPLGGRQKRHGCRLRFLSRTRWRGHLAGWHEGYRFAVEHPADPMVLADADDYGTGWAGHMRVGHVTVVTPESGS